MTLKEYFEPKPVNRLVISCYTEYVFLDRSDLVWHSTYINSNGDRKFMAKGTTIFRASDTIIPTYEDELPALFPTITRKDGKPLGGVVEQPKPLKAGTKVKLGYEFTLIHNRENKLCLLKSHNKIVTYHPLDNSELCSLKDAFALGLSENWTLTHIEN